MAWCSVEAQEQLYLHLYLFQSDTQCDVVQSTVCVVSFDLSDFGRRKQYRLFIIVQREREREKSVSCLIPNRERIFEFSTLS